MSATPAEWDDEQRELFGRVFRFMDANQKAFSPAPPMDPMHWDTIAYNAAYAAAELMRSPDFTLVDSRTGELVAHTDQGPLS